MGHVFLLFLKSIKTISICSLKIVICFILFLENNDQIMLEIFKNGFLFFKNRKMFFNHTIKQTLKFKKI